MEFLGDILATVGKYKDRQTGEERKSFAKCGAAFKNEQGRIVLKIDTIPVTQEWSGWLTIYPPKERSENEQEKAEEMMQPTQQRRRPAPQQPRQTPKPQSDGMDDDDVPF